MCCTFIWHPRVQWILGWLGNKVSKSWCLCVKMMKNRKFNTFQLKTLQSRMVQVTGVCPKEYVVSTSFERCNLHEFGA